MVCEVPKDDRDGDRLAVSDLAGSQGERAVSRRVSRESIWNSWGGQGAAL